MAAGRGTLVLVVGPSGVGKDTLIAGARDALAGDPAFVFPRREVTRPAGLGGEDYLPLEIEAFQAREAAGAYCLSWRAHGLHYGIGRSVQDDLADGRHVIANVSRTVIDQARARLAPIRVVSVTVPEAALAVRLRARGREDEAAIAGRLARARAFDADGPDVMTLVTDRTAAESVARFLALLRELAVAR